MGPVSADRQFWGVGASPPAPPVPAEPPLDRQLRELPPIAGAPWGRAAAVTVVGTIALIATGTLAARLLPLGGFGAAVLSLAGEVGLGVITYLAVRPVLAAYSGAASVIGWAPPRIGDPGRGLAWFVLQKIVQVLLLVALTVAIPHLSAGQYSNTLGVTRLSPAALAVFGVAAVVIAPLVEETQFRGVLLRAGMRRWGFWGGALSSSLLFGAFHSYEAATPLGGLVLGTIMAVFGLLQCLLVRATGRLFPAVVAHAASNALSLILLAG